MAERFVPSFGVFLSRQVLDNFDSSYVRKKRGDEYWVPAAAPTVVGALVFQTGAVLGHARPDRSDALANLLSLTRENEAVTFENALRALLVNWLARMKGTPQSLQEVWNLTQFPDVDLTDMNTLKGLMKDEIRLGTLFDQAKWAVVYGVAFGMFHGYFEQLWRNTFETAIDPAKWREMKAAGLDIPEQQELYPLAAATIDTLNQTAAYVRAYRPELLDPLNLADHGKD